VRCKGFQDGLKLHGKPHWEKVSRWVKVVVVVVVGQNEDMNANVPCSRREVPPGTYLRTTFLRRYWTRPYKGDFSSYCCITLLTSCTPPVPFFNSSTVSRLAYLSRNLATRQHLAPPLDRPHDATYHPPGSASAAWCASATATPSSPFKDIAQRHLGSLKGLQESVAIIDIEKARIH
jgi:hypothetical protein